MDSYKDRQKYNLLILDKLKSFLSNEKNKDLRFIQALWALRIVDSEDRFYEESEKTYEKIT